jgi:hypothetical protein
MSQQEDTIQQLQIENKTVTCRVVFAEFPRVGSRTSHERSSRSSIGGPREEAVHVLFIATYAVELHVLVIDAKVVDSGGFGDYYRGEKFRVRQLETIDDVTTATRRAVAVADDLRKRMVGNLVEQADFKILTEPKDEDVGRTVDGERVPG